VNVQRHSSASIPSPSAARERDPAANQDKAEGVQGRFRRSARLLRHADFQRVYKQGRRHFGPYMTVFYLERPVIHAARASTAQGPRIGFTVPRALGGAVERNRIKRRMREAVRANISALTATVDVVINPKKSAERVEFSILRSEIVRAFGVIQGSETKFRGKT
jgi:ribonuclease P protein component